MFKKVMLILVISILFIVSNVFAAYFGDTNGILYKVDNSGNHIWNVTLHSAIDIYDIAVDSSENVYAIGDDNGGLPTNFYLFKYDYVGNQIWNVSLSGSNNNKIRGLDVDSSGNVIIGIYDNVAANVIEYNSSGDLQWNTTFVGCKTQSITLDSQGNVFVGSECNKGDLIKLNSLGVYVWNTTFDNGGAQQKVFNVDFDSSDNIYVAYAAYFGGGRIANLFKLNSLGTIQWNDTFDSVDNTPAPDVAVDLNDNIFYSFNSVLTTGTVIKYDSSGSRLVNSTFSSTSLFQFDTDTSEIGGGGNNSGVVFAFGMDSSLNQLWNYTADDTAGTFYSVAFDPDSNGPTMINCVSDVSSGNSGDSFELNYTGTELSGIDTVWMVLQKNDEDNNLTITLSGNGSDYNVTWDSTGYENGNYLIDVYANDTLGNQKKSDNYLVVTLVPTGTTVTDYVNNSINLTANTGLSLDDSANTGVALDLYVTQEINDTSISFNAYDQNVESNTNGFGSVALGKYFSITVSNDTNGNLSNADSQIRFYYTDAEVSAAGIDESTLKLYRFNTTINEWSELEITGVDMVNNYIWGNVSSFSSFGVAGSGVSVASTVTSTLSSDGSGGSSGITAIRPGDTTNVEILKDATLKTRMSQDSTITFNYNGEKHSINLKEVNNELNSITLEIRSSPQLIKLRIGETKDVDLDSDGVLDVRIYLKNLIGATADLEFIGLNIGFNKQNIVKEEVSEEGKTLSNVRKILPIAFKKSSKKWPYIILFGLIIILIVIFYFKNKSKEGNYPEKVKNRSR